MNQINDYGDNFYLEFTMQGEIESLALIFVALKQAKDEYWNDAFEEEKNSEPPQASPADDPKWIDYLNEAAWNYFSQRKNPEEEAIYNQLWRLTKPAVRLTHPMFNRGENWDFESLIEAVFNGEYTLVEIRKLDEKRAVLLYNPWSYPFGGSECLAVLVESFGHYVTYDYWHQGPHQRGEVGWNYALARELVKRNKGFEPQS